MLTTIDPIAPSDFDFIIGDWKVQHRRLNERLCDCDNWTEFSGESSTSKILGGFGNLEDNLLHLPTESFHAVALRSYCSSARRWSIWWLDGRNPTHLDVPVTGEFRGDTGLFFSDDVLHGRAIKVRFTWHAPRDANPRWEQAFSADGGASWETNWTMEFFPAQ